MDPSGTLQRFKYACNECQRRKQKCNRIYPCLHCKSRGAQRDCHFKEKASKTASQRPQVNVAVASETAVGAWAKGKGAGRKRSRDSGDDNPDYSDDSDSGPDSDTDIGNGKLDSVGQGGAAAGSDNPQLSSRAKMKQLKSQRNNQYYISPADCPELRNALELLPRDRKQADALTLSFFQNVNPHYGMIHKDDFGREYDRWWSRRKRNASLPVPWTCLLLMMCACACQHLPIDIQKKLEKMLGASCQECTESFHYSARYLYNTMPADRYHKNNVLWFLHSTYWYKAEAMFTEACHIFYTAVHEAKALGFDKEEDVSGVPNFELEMRRRAWCVIDSWDWQIASGLSRKTMIDHSTCHAKRPSLTLEPDGEFSPLMHMNMQSDLIHRLAGRFPSPSQVKTRSDIMEYKGMIDEWMQNFPPIFALVNPDTSNDKRQAWIEYHRHYNYTMGYMMVLNPFRPHMALPYTDKSSVEELELRRIAVDLTLLIIQVLDNWLKFLTFRDGRFHFIIFSLVDAATVLSNMVLNDKAETLPRRDDIYRALKTALVLQRKLYFLSDSAKVGFRIVQRIVRHLFRSTPKSYLDSLEIDGESHHDDTQPVLSAAPDRASSGALMNVQNIDPEDPIGPGLWDQTVIEAPARKSDAGTGSQLVHDTAPVASSYNDGAAVAPGGYTGCVEEHVPSEHQIIASSSDASAIATSFDYTECTIPTSTGAAPLDYTSTASSHYATSVSPSYVATTAHQLPAVTSTYVESALPRQTSAASSDYASAVSQTFVTPPSSGPVTSTSSNYILTTSYYVEPVLTDHVSYAPLDYVPDASLNDTLDYTAFYATGTSPAYSAATSAYIDPAFLSTHSPSTAYEYSAATSALSTEPIAELSSSSIPTIVADTTIYDTPVPYLPWAVYNEAGLYTTPKSHDSSAVHDTAVPFDAPTTYATPASYTSPESYASSETHWNHPIVYDTPPSCIVPTTYASSTFYTASEGYNSPESHGATGDYTGAASISTALPSLAEENIAHAVSTSHETPESYYTAPAYTTPLQNSASPDMEPPA